MADVTLPAPTAEQCSAGLRVEVDDDTAATAAWWPQTGGYVGRCWIVSGRHVEPDSCVDVHVWHDGQFPFAEDGRSPTVLHLCVAAQFREFADAIERANVGGDGG